MTILVNSSIAVFSANIHVKKNMTFHIYLSLMNIASTIKVSRLILYTNTFVNGFHAALVTNLFIRSRQVALFLQGLDEHSLMSTSHCDPEKPC